MKSNKRKCYKFSPEIKVELKPLYKLDNWHGVLALSIGYLIILFSIVSTIYSHYFLYPIAIFIIASRQRALATIQHEASHFVLAKNKFLNRLLGSVFSGNLIFQGFNTYIKSHVYQHHIFLGDENYDPDYKYHLGLGLYNSQNPSIAKSSLAKFMNIFTYILSYTKYVTHNRVFTLKINIDSIMIAIVHLIIISGLFLLHWLTFYIVFWLIPLFVFFPLIGWFIEVAEHYPLVHVNNLDLHMTRNRFSHVVEALFFSMHNENYHLVHHLKPGIPFWNLKKAHKILLKDENYKLSNKAMGGIFISVNKSQTIFKLLFERI